VVAKKDHAIGIDQQHNARHHMQRAKVGQGTELQGFRWL
jgi:hypothetical protein